MLRWLAVSTRKRPGQCHSLRPGLACLSDCRWIARHHFVDDQAVGADALGCCRGVFRHRLSECLDSAREVTHQATDTAAAEHQQYHRRYDHPVHWAEATHFDISHCLKRNGRPARASRPSRYACRRAASAFAARSMLNCRKAGLCPMNNPSLIKALTKPAAVNALLLIGRIVAQSGRLALMNWAGTGKIRFGWVNT